MSVPDKERLIHILDESEVLIKISKRVGSADELYKDMFLSRSAERSIEAAHSRRSPPSGD